MQGLLDIDIPTRYPRLVRPLSLARDFRLARPARIARPARTARTARIARAAKIAMTARIARYCRPPWLASLHGLLSLPGRDSPEGQ